MSFQVEGRKLIFSSQLLLVVSQRSSSQTEALHFFSFFMAVIVTIDHSIYRHDIMSPVNYIVMACFLCIHRPISIAEVELNNPIWIHEVANFHLVDWYARSHDATNWKPAAIAIPSTWAIKGFLNLNTSPSTKNFRILIPSNYDPSWTPCRPHWLRVNIKILVYGFQMRLRLFQHRTGKRISVLQLYFW